MTLPVIPSALIDETCAAAGLESKNVQRIEWDARTGLVTFHTFLTRDGRKYVDESGEVARETVLAALGAWS